MKQEQGALKMEQRNKQTNKNNKALGIKCSGKM